jgi:ParB-like chromosome segregation protein Spo0J
MSDESFQVMPSLTEEEYSALREDIETNGVLVPVVTDQHGTIIDGHHRRKIADELGIPYETKTRNFASDEERYEFALGLNLKRRHLTREQMRELIASEIERTPDASDRAIGRRLGCSHRTVAAVRRPSVVDNLSTIPMPPGLIPPTTPGGAWQVQIPDTLDGAVAQLNALGEWEEQVDKLAALSPEEAARFAELEAIIDQSLESERRRQWTDGQVVHLAERTDRPMEFACLECGKLHPACTWAIEEAERELAELDNLSTRTWQDNAHEYALRVKLFGDPMGHDDEDDEALTP